MLKKYVEIKLGDKVLVVCPIKECDSLKFIEIEREAQKNLKNVLTFVKVEKNKLTSKIEQLEKEIKILKGEE